MESHQVGGLISQHNPSHPPISPPIDTCWLCSPLTPQSGFAQRITGKTVGALGPSGPSVELNDPDLENCLVDHEIALGMVTSWAFLGRVFTFVNVAAVLTAPLDLRFSFENAVLGNVISKLDKPVVMPSFCLGNHSEDGCYL